MFPECILNVLKSRVIIKGAAIRGTERKIMAQRISNRAANGLQKVAPGELTA